MRAGSRLWIVAALTAIVLLSMRFDLAPSLRGPAPYPPEWQWRHRPRTLLRAAPAVPIALALAGLLAWSGTTAARRRPRFSAALVIAGGLVLGGAFPLVLLGSEDGGAVSYLVRRTASPGYLSYHAVAVSPVGADVRRFLQDYSRLLPGLPVHAATHPPGPVVAFRALISILERCPAIRAGLDARVLDACGAGVDGCGPHVAALAPSARTAALAGALLLHAVAVATVLPLAWLAFQLTRDRLAAARTAALWPLVPGAALFVPALDPAIAFPVTAALAGLRAALTGERGTVRAGGIVIAAVTGAAALYLSYGAAVFLLLGAGAIVASLPSWTLARGAPRLAMPLVSVAALGALLALLPMAVGHDPFAAARAALHRHGAEFTAQRSYPLWLVFGPLDVMLFLGVPLALGFARHVARTLRSGIAAASPPARLAVATAVALVLLFASGLVRGETGRLFVPLLPLGLLAGALRLDEEPGPGARTAATFALLLAALDVVMRLNWRI